MEYEHYGVRYPVLKHTHTDCIGLSVILAVLQVSCDAAVLELTGCPETDI